MPAKYGDAGGTGARTETLKRWHEPWALRELRFKQPPGEWAKHLVLEVQGGSDPLEPWYHPNLTQFSTNHSHIPIQSAPLPYLALIPQPISDFILTLVSP